MSLHHPHTLKIGSPDAPRHIVIFHGYTGSPDEFRELGQELAERLDAHVSVPLLPGHGTDERDLLSLELEDFVEAAHQHVAEVERLGKPFAICGHSFGGHLAALTATRHKPHALVLTIMPYLLHFPFSLPGMALFMHIKKFWNKHLTREELKDRRYKFFYPHMPGIALSLIKKANVHIDEALRNLDFPILTINTREDPIIRPESGEVLLSKSAGHPESKSIVLDHRRHGLFLHKDRREPEEDIIEFLSRELA